VILGNGTPQHARWFIEDYGIGVPVVVDPKRVTYGIVKARRPFFLHPGSLIAGARAFSRGFRQTRPMGDTAQLGGVFVITPAGDMPYRYLSAFAGDHPPPGDAVEVVERLARS
jgi:hypothetical protein